MASSTDDGDAPLSPDDAFALLGNETRMEMLRALGDADEPVSFSALREAVGVRDSGQFNYHLDKLAGHFVRNTEEGYALRRAGERVIEAVLSGAVTEDPVFDPAEIDQPCPVCGAPVEASYRDEWVALSCTECEGVYGESLVADQEKVSDQLLDRGYLGGLSLPPAGIQGRDAEEVVRAADVWGTMETLAAAEGICPRCSAGVDHAASVCTDHDASGAPCERCGSRCEVAIEWTCPNCPYAGRGMFVLHLATDTDLVAFVAVRGYNPIVPTDLRAAMDVDAEVVSTDPFEARFTVSLDGDAITLTVDDDLDVVAVSGDTA